MSVHVTDKELEEIIKDKIARYPNGLISTRRIVSILKSKYGKRAFVGAVADDVNARIMIILRRLGFKELRHFRKERTRNNRYTNFVFAKERRRLRHGN